MQHLLGILKTSEHVQHLCKKKKKKMAEHKNK